MKWKSFSDQKCVDRFTHKFLMHGVKKEQLEFRGASTHFQMLEEYNDVDIVLDTFPFSGALTSCEALWMGRPVITYFMERPVSRQSYSILKQLNKDQWCASTIQHYVDIAVELAGSFKTRNEFYTTVRETMLESPLMDAKHQAHELVKFSHTVI